MRVWIQRLLLLSLAAFFGFVGGWLTARIPSSGRIDRVVAMGWGDGSPGRPSYGAHVYLEPLDEGGGYSVRARVYIGRGAAIVAYFHDMGEIGKAVTDAEAVARWGTITWRADGVQLGTGPDAAFLAREQLERGR
jgi:hypothetical protein